MPAAAEDRDVGRFDAGHSAQQDAAAHLRPFEVLGPFLDAHPPGHFAHRRQQRQAALVVAERFIGHGDRAALQEVLGQLAIGGEVEIGEDDLPLPQQPALAGLGLLDLDDHLRPAVDLFGRGDHFRPMAGVLVVAQAGAGARARLDQHAVSGAGQFFRPHGQQADAVFVILDLFGDSDEHGSLLRDVKADAAAWFFRLLQHGIEGLDDGLDLLVVQLHGLGQPRELLDQFARRGHQTAKTHEGPHDLDIHPHGGGGRSTLESMATPCSVKTQGSLRRPPRPGL